MRDPWIASDGCSYERQVGLDASLSRLLACLLSFCMCCDQNEYGDSV
jgi:hypothetical protein